MEEVVNRFHALGGENFGNARADPFYILNGGGQFEHLKGW